MEKDALGIKTDDMVEYQKLVIDSYKAAVDYLTKSDGFAAIKYLDDILDTCKKYSWPLPEYFCQNWVKCGEVLLDNGQKGIEFFSEDGGSDMFSISTRFFEAGLQVSGKSPVENPYEFIEGARNPK
jgi:hypothetical protein